MTRELRLAVAALYVVAAGMPACAGTHVMTDAGAVVMTCELDAANPNEAIGTWLLARQRCGLSDVVAPPWGSASWVPRSCVDDVAAATCVELADVAAACGTCEAP